MEIMQVNRTGGVNYESSSSSPSTAKEDEGSISIESSEQLGGSHHYRERPARLGNGASDDAKAEKLDSHQQPQAATQFTDLLDRSTLLSALKANKEKARRPDDSVGEQTPSQSMSPPGKLARQSTQFQPIKEDFVQDGPPRTAGIKRTSTHLVERQPHPDSSFADSTHRNLVASNSRILGESSLIPKRSTMSKTADFQLPSKNDPSEKRQLNMLRRSIQQKQSLKSRQQSASSSSTIEKASSIADSIRFTLGRLVYSRKSKEVSRGYNNSGAFQGSNEAEDDRRGTIQMNDRAPKLSPIKQRAVKSEKWSSNKLSYRVPQITGQREFSSSDSSSSLEHDNQNDNNTIQQHGEQTFGQRVLNKLGCFKKAKPELRNDLNEDVFTLAKPKPARKASLPEIVEESLAETVGGEVLRVSQKSAASASSCSPPLSHESHPNSQGLQFPSSEDCRHSRARQAIQEIDIMRDDPSCPKSQSESPFDLLDGTSDDENLTRFSKKIRNMDTTVQDQIIIQQLKVVRQNYPLRVKWDLCIMVLSVWNSLVIPIDIAFQPLSFRTTAMLSFNHVIDFLFLVDIVINFRTTFHNPISGDEVFNPKQIALNYIMGGRFWMDVLATIPFDVVMGLFFRNGFSLKYQLLSMLKLFRILRLSRIINYMNSTDEVKLSLKLFQLCLFLILYIHCTACLLFYVANLDHSWQPGQLAYYADDLYDAEHFYEGEPTHKQYIISFYNSILMLTGNDIYPSTFLQYILTSSLLICGALINANIFGTIAVIAQTFNRKTSRFQEQIDVANTSMKNMKLPEHLQSNVREFMMQTQSNLDSQNELDQFLNMISPSLRLQVTQHIFLNAISKNPIFSDNSDLIDFLINDISTRLCMPEDVVVQQGTQGDALFLIAQGDCEVWVKDHLRQNRYVRQVFQGEYFGELSLLTQAPRSATVKSSNYCTLARLSKKTFYDLCGSFPGVFIKMKRKALEYKDPWKQFKKKILRQVDYFESPFLPEEFLEDTHYYLQEEFFEKGTEVIATGEPCNSIIFIVQGFLELRVFDEEGNSTILETLKQGDMVGQYSVLFNEGFLFTAIAQTNLRLLTLDQSFFVEQKDLIDGLEEALLEAEETIQTSGIAVCDFKIFDKEACLQERFQRAVERAKVLNTIRKKDPRKLVHFVKQAQQQHKDKALQRTLNRKKRAQMKAMTQNSQFLSEALDQAKSRGRTEKRGSFQVLAHNRRKLAPEMEVSSLKGSRCTTLPFQRKSINSSDFRALRVAGANSQKQRKRLKQLGRLQSMQVREEVTPSLLQQGLIKSIKRSSMRKKRILLSQLNKSNADSSSASEPDDRSLGSQRPLSQHRPKNKLPEIIYNRGDSGEDEESVFTEANFERLFRTAQQAQGTKDKIEKTKMIKQAKRTLQKIASQLEELDSTTGAADDTSPKKSSKIKTGTFADANHEVSALLLQKTTSAEALGPQEPEQFLAYDEDFFSSNVKSVKGSSFKSDRNQARRREIGANLANRPVLEEEEDQYSSDRSAARLEEQNKRCRSEMQGRGLDSDSNHAESHCEETKNNELPEPKLLNFSRPSRFREELPPLNPDSVAQAVLLEGITKESGQSRSVRASSRASKLSKVSKKSKVSNVSKGSRASQPRGSNLLRHPDKPRKHSELIQSPGSKQEESSLQSFPSSQESDSDSNGATQLSMRNQFEIPSRVRKQSILSSGKNRAFVKKITSILKNS